MNAPDNNATALTYETNGEDLLDIGYHYEGEIRHQTRTWDSAVIQTIQPLVAPATQAHDHSIALEIEDPRQLAVASGVFSQESSPERFEPDTFYLAPTVKYALRGDGSGNPDGDPNTISLVMGRLHRPQALSNESLKGRDRVAEFFDSTWKWTDDMGTEMNQFDDVTYTLASHSVTNITAVDGAAVHNQGGSRQNAGMSFAAAVVRTDRDPVPNPPSLPEGWPRPASPEEVTTTFDEIHVYRINDADSGLFPVEIGSLALKDNPATTDIDERFLPSSDDIHISDVAIAANEYVDGQTMTDVYVFWIERDDLASGEGTLHGAWIENAGNRATVADLATSDVHLDLLPAVFIENNGSIDADWDFVQAAPRITFIYDPVGGIVEQAHAARVELTAGQPVGTSNLTALVTTGSSPTSPEGANPTIALNNAGGIGPRAYAAHWFSSSGFGFTYKNQLTVPSGDSWSSAVSLEVAAEPSFGQVFDPSITYRFTGAELSIRAQKRDYDIDSQNEAELVTNREILVQNEFDTLAQLLLPQVATNAQNLTDVFAAHALPEDNEDAVTIIAIDP